MTLIALNPSTGDELARFDEPTPEELEAKLAKAQAAYLDWKARPVSERAALVARQPSRRTARGRPARVRTTMRTLALGVRSSTR